MIEWLAFGVRCVLLISALGAAGHVAVFMIHRVTTPRVTLAVLVALASVIGFLTQAAAMTGTVAGALDPVMLGILWSTGQGTAMALYVCGAIVVVVGTFVRRPVLQAFGAVTLLAGFVAVGHVSGVLLNVILILHLMLASYWVGVLWPIFRIAGSDHEAAAELAMDFGRYALMAVPVLVGLGGVMAFNLLDNLAQLCTTAYGVTLLVKMLAVSAMLIIGAMNKLRHVPALRRGQARPLRFAVFCEGAFALAVLGATAALSTVAGLG
ncbi:CopD family protein [Tateyamaria sp. SN6-1]|uniref:CopD family protein n=1 Tax=Tateyamaria sp. SN6-1 TaxID=3092148 RepID=UPI0039F48E8D